MAFNDLDSAGVAEARVEMELNLSVNLTTLGGDLIREGSAPLGAYRRQFHPSREEQHAEPVKIKTLEHPLLVSYEGRVGENVICDVALLIVLVCLGPAAGAFDFGSRRTYGIRFRGVRFGEME